MDDTSINNGAQPLQPTSAAGPNPPPSAVDTGNPSTASTPSTPADPSTPASPADPTNRMPVGPANPNKTMKPQPAVPGQPTQPVDHSADPAVQHASKMYSVAQALAGGPHYRIDTNLDAGTTKKVPVPLSSRQIAMAIAMEAISGGLAGMAGGRGKGAGAAGVAGFEHGRQMVKQQQDKTQQDMDQANKNVTQHYQVVEANMRMMSVAQTMGRMDQEMHDNMVKMSGEQLKYLKDNTPELIGEERVSEQDSKDLQKYPMHDWTRMPDGTVPRMNADGNPVFIDMSGKMVPEGTPGSHQAMDNTYSMVHKNAKIGVSGEDGTSPEFIKSAVGWNLLDKSWLKSGPGAEISASLAATLSRKVDSLNAADTDLKKYFDTLNVGSGKGKSTDDSGDETDAGSMPNIKDDKIAAMIDDAGNKYGVSPAMLRALILTESGNLKTGEVNPRAVSPKGAKGLGQFMPATAKIFGITDPFDPQQSITATARYMRDLLVSKGSPQAALAAYHGIGSDGITTDSQYVNKIMKLAGMTADSSGKAESVPKYQPTDLRAEIKKDPSLATALTKFQAMFNAAGSREQAIAELAKKDPAAAGKVARLYGGRDALHDFDMTQKLKDQKLMSDQKTDEEMDKKKQEEGAIIKRNDRLIDAMLDGKMFNLYHIATMRAYDRETIINEAQRRAEERGIEWNPEEVNTRIGLYNEASGNAQHTPGSFANSVMNAKTSLSHMGGAMDALDKLKAKYPEFTDNDYAHKSMQWFNDKFGTDDDWIKYKTDLHTAATDWQNLLNNQHALTDHDKDVASKVSATDAPFSNTTAALQEMAHTAAARITPLNDRWKQYMGADFPDLLNDEAVRAIKKIGSPEVIRILGNMQVGGNLRNSSTGQGTPGRKVSDMLKEMSGGPNKPAPAPDGTIVNNKNGQGQSIKRDGKWVPYTPQQKPVETDPSLVSSSGLE